MIIFGTKFWAWGSALTQAIWTCGKCGYRGQFVEKSGMTFITFYWVIPVIPISGVKKMVQCPNCKTRYQNNTPPNGANGGMPNGGGGQPPIANPWS